MNWTDILISLAVGIGANLLTPSIRSFALRTALSVGAVMRVSGRKVTAIRLRQLREERAIIESFHERPLTLANRIVYHTAPQVIVLWILLGAFLYLVLSGQPSQLSHSAWTGAIFGVLGFATRFPVGMMVALRDLQKVNAIATYRKNNDSAQEYAIALLQRASES